jgi:hypothetical protein
VTVGGPYFDLLQGRYELEPIPGGTRVRLTNRFRISTHFNAYAGLWARWILADIQGAVLEVIRDRSERAATDQP